MQWDLLVDLHRIDANWLTLASTDDRRPGVHLHQGGFVLVEDDGAELAVAVVTNPDDGLVRLRVLPGPASRYPDVLAKATVGAD